MTEGQAKLARSLFFTSGTTGEKGLSLASKLGFYLSCTRSGGEIIIMCTLSDGFRQG
jgi:hypothetical protein